MEDDDDSDARPGREIQQLSREERLRRREEARERARGGRNARGTRQSTLSRAQRAQRRDRQARYRIDSEDDDDDVGMNGSGLSESSDDDDDVSLVDSDGSGDSDDSDDSDNERGVTRRGGGGPSGAGRSDGAGPSRRSGRSGRSGRSTEPSRRGGRKRTRAQRDGEPEPEPREVGSFMWLMSHAKQGGLYVPQVGDEVVYIKRGHTAALEKTDDPAPECLDDLNEAEPCTVERVSYFVARDGTDGTAAKLLLRTNGAGGSGTGRRVIDSDSDSGSDGGAGGGFGGGGAAGNDRNAGHHHEFEVNVYSPLAGLPDFLVLRTLFDETAPYAWREGDACKAMFWNDDREDWYEGSIVGDALEDYSTVSNPYEEASLLWERFTVKWDLEEEDSSHSPWEIRPQDADENEYDRSELDEAVATRAKEAIVEAAKQFDWDIFQVAPLRDDAYQSHRDVIEYYNQLVALPIGLMDIQARLDNGYYRRPAALQRDIALIAENAVSFNGENHEVSRAATKLSRFLAAVVDGSSTAADIATFVAPSESDEDGDGDVDETGGRGPGARGQGAREQGARGQGARGRRSRSDVAPVPAPRRTGRERRAVQLFAPTAGEGQRRRNGGPPPRRSTRGRGDPTQHRDSDFDYDEGEEEIVEASTPRRRSSRR